MATILCLTGVSRGDALSGITRGVTEAYQAYGIEVAEINFSDVKAALDKIEALVGQKTILFALSYAGIGRDINVRDAKNRKRNLWDMLNIPVLTAHGDSPAYFFERHISPSAGFANLYAFREHYDFRKSLPADLGMHALSQPFLFDREPEGAIDFKAKEGAKLVFPKNSNDPVKLRTLWRERCTPGIAAMLNEFADILDASVANPMSDNIPMLVESVLGEKGYDITTASNLRLFFVAQLDDYLRRVKCTMLGEVLRDFPVEIHGENWEHVDFSNSKCTFVPQCDYAQTRQLMKGALGVIDLSPNTQYGFHDRSVRAYAMQTLCVANEQACLDAVFGENLPFTYRFEPESIAATISEIIARPKEYVELGRELSRVFDIAFPAENLVRSTLEIADLLRLANSRVRPGMQDFFMWPPGWEEAEQELREQPVAASTH